MNLHRTEGESSYYCGSFVNLPPESLNTYQVRTRTLNRGHHSPLEVWIDVDVLRLLRSHWGRSQHHPWSLNLGGHVHSLRWGGVMWML